MTYTDLRKALSTEYYEDAVSFIQSIPRFTDSDRYTHAKRFCDMLLERYADKGYAPKVFHVAGTNGKGSVCAFLASMHKAMGKSAGVFTSPHLTDIRERIVLEGEYISREAFLECFTEVAESLMRYNDIAGQERIQSEQTADAHSAVYVPVYFDYLFFMALIYFMKKKPDCIIWEVGLGGRFDATNTIPYKSVAIITRIGFDHMEILGDSKGKIAYEKAGIIACGTPVVTVDNDKEVLDVITSCAEDKKAPLTVVPGVKDIKKKLNDKRIDFSYESHYYNNATLAIVGNAARALYQTENAYMAITAMEQVYNKDELDLDIICKGIEDMNWPGRMEEIAEGICFDGAHNTDGISAFVESVKHDGCCGKRYLLFSAVADKQVDKELMMLAGSSLFEAIGLCPIHSERATGYDELVRLSRRVNDMGVITDVYANVAEGFKIMSEAKRENDRLYVCGSLYLVGELKSMLQENKRNI